MATETLDPADYEKMAKTTVQQTDLFADKNSSGDESADECKPQRTIKSKGATRFSRGRRTR